MSVTVSDTTLKECILRRNKGIWYFVKQEKYTRLHRSLRTRIYDEAIERARKVYLEFVGGIPEGPKETKYSKESTLKEFSDYFVFSKLNSRPATVVYYKKYQRLVLKYFGEDFQIGKMTLKRAQDFHSFLKSKGLKVRTIRHQILLLKQIFKTAFAERVLWHNPLELLNLPKIGFEKPKYLRVDEIPKFINALREYDRLPCLLSLSTGMRMCEVIKLEWSMISLADRLISIPVEIAKSNEERIIPIRGRILEALTAVWISRNPANPYVFPSKRSVDSGRKQIRGSVKEAFVKIGRPDLTFHCLRKTFATHYLAYTDDLNGLMQMGGWKDVRTVRIYAGITAQTLSGRSDKVASVTSKWFESPNQKITNKLVPI